MKILLNDKLQYATGVPSLIISPALADRYTASNTFTATFPSAETVDCIGLGYTDTTSITVRNDNPFGIAELNYPLVSDALDISGNGNNGTETDITWTGGVANFNGTSSRITSGDILSNIVGYSFYFKIKRNGIPSSLERIFTKRIDGNYFYYCGLETSTGYLLFGVGNNVTTHELAIAEINICNNIEHSILLNIIDSTHIMAYVDNIAYSIKILTTAIVSISGVDFTIGRNPAGTQYLTGTISNFYIFNRALTDEERTSIYNGDMLQTVPITQDSPYQNGLYLLTETNGTVFTIDHNGTYIGRVGLGVYRTLGTSPTKEIGFFTTNESRRTLSGQVIAGAGGYCGRTADVDVRYKIDEDVYNDIESAFCSQISREFPYFILFDDEQHKFPDTMLHFYASTDKPLSKLQSSSYKFLYSYKFKFEEAF